MSSQYGEFLPPQRLLMGAGPSNVHPRVLQAMTASLLGHLDPVFLQAMDDVRGMLREVFMTENAATLPVSGTGTAGMEAACVNILEPGDVFIVATNGYFGERLAEIASRTGATVVTVEHEVGEPVTASAIKAELAKHDKVKGVGVVHAETSTGVVTPIADIAKVVHDAGALLVVDAVTSLGGVELRVDAWDIDVCYSGTQKCVGAPPGLAPITFGQRAIDVMTNRKTKVQSFYLDMTALVNYWEQRVYHHTAPISMIYSLREALRLVLEEGLENRWKRHATNAAALVAGIDAMGLRIVANPDYRLPALTAVYSPDGIPEANVRKHLLENFNIEVSGGLATMPLLAGKIWRIGLMGQNSTASNVFFFLSALEAALAANEYEVAAGAGVAAAQRKLRELNG
jgi:alanine-glyoxylate transaminase / serine-glyoxylate transaminase / serine-pyruvate transaminase